MPNRKQMKQDQHKYIKGLKSGDQKVFGELFQAYYEPLCRYCMRVIPDQDEAEEIVQEMFVNLWSKRDEINIGVSLNAYLYRMVMNRAINYSNHLKIRKSHQEWVQSMEIEKVKKQRWPICPISEGKCTITHEQQMSSFTFIKSN